MMATRHALAAAATTGGCLRCRSSALRLLLTPASPFAASRSSVAAWRPAVLSPPSRYFASASTPKPEEPTVADVLDETREQASGGPAETESKNDVPWYLQVEPPTHGIATQPPPLPDIPDGSPPIIGSVLKYAAEELGLEDLSLLDLRALDPPSALGPNLFMLFGNARSSRHIHVSASRLVKWLRYEHTIHANADGLVGPGQRKRLQKRANRRARLLGNVEDEEAAITDWICVNLGTLNRSNEDATLVDDGGRVTGFGASLTGLTIVVQIMTSERRAALGLEGLWQRSLERQQKKREMQKAELDDSTSGAKDGLHPLEQAILAKPATPSQQKSQRPLRNAGLSSQQSRAFSTQRTCPDTQRMSSKLPEFVPPPNTFVDPLDVQEDLSPDSLLRLQETLRTDGAQKSRVLKLLEAHLDGATPEDAATKLTPSFDSVSAQAMQNMTLEQTWPLRLAMEYAARGTATRKRQTSLGPVRALFEELRVSATPASYDQFLRLLFCIYASDAPLDDRTKLAHEFLGILEFRVQEVIRNDILVTIIEATSLAMEPKEREKTKALQTRLEELRRLAKLPYMGEPLLVRLLNSYARQLDWDEFWAAWNMPPEFMQPRSEALYLYMYRLATSSGSKRLCIDTVRRCFQGMLTEEPPVPPTGRIRDTLLQCIDIVDPRAIQMVNQFPGLSSKWVDKMSQREFVGLVANLKALERQEQELL